MKTATFENTVDILVKAYFDGYLQPMSCKACAVGNLVATGMGYTFRSAWGWNETNEAAWKDVVGIMNILPLNYNGLAKQQIDSTGYTPDELWQIEEAFMTDTDDNFVGLMAVVDVLADIHGISLEQKSEAKAMFVKETP